MLLFVAGLLLGVLSTSISLTQSLGTIPTLLLNMPRFQIFLLIVKKNAKSLIMLWSGALTFGVTTLHNLMVNSLVIGAVLKTAVMQMGLKPHS
nr:stage II sporulation protein M [Pyrococcus abyssi]